MSAQTTPTKDEKLSDTYPYPLCWQDNERVQVLLAPFRDRSVNPENYDSKMKFWQDTIREYCLFKGKAYFCKQELQHNFTKGQRVPCCFDNVLEEMQRQKLLRLRKDYEYDPDNSWSGWAVNSFLKKPLSWGLARIKAKLGATDNMNSGLMQFIHLEVISKYCADLQQLLLTPAYVGKLHHYDDLQKEVCVALNISEECLRICLHTLHVRRKIVVEYKSNKNELQIHLVKIPSSEDNDVTITETDHAIHNLQVTKTSLEKQLEDIEMEIKNNDTKAKQYIKENKRLMAKGFLRKKHLLEKNHERRSIALHNIEAMLSTVHESQLNGVILDAYKFGSKALQNVLDDSNLKYDNVDEIVSDVRETMDSFREIQDTMANANLNESVATPADEDELERELREIMGESAQTTTRIQHTADNKNTSVSMPMKIEITDAELLQMLNDLEVKENSPKKVVKKNILLS